MPDVFDEQKRSDVMSRIRGRANASTELTLAAALRRAGIKGWRRHLVVTVAPGRLDQPTTRSRLAVKPDFVFRKERMAVFVDGCFWHQCPFHSNLPANNREFWQQKLQRNVQRDMSSSRALRRAGWRVVRIWEHQLTSKNIDAVTRQILRLLTKHSRIRHERAKRSAT